MLIEHRGKRPRIDETAWVAPNATVAGDVTIGRDCRIMFGAVITAAGGPVEIGVQCIVMENAVLRGTPKHPLRIGDHVLIGPRAYLSGCIIEDDVFLATGATIFNGARIATRAEVRINGTVHVNSVVPTDATVPINWVAVGDPAEIRPPGEHDEIWAVQEGLDFPGTAFGLAPAPDGGSIMPEMTRRYARALARHADDRIIDEE